jgi:spore coat protein H
MRIYLLILSLAYTTGCISQVLTINVSENNFGIDENRSLIVSRIQNISNYEDTSNYDEIVITLGQNYYSFISIPNSLEYSSSYVVSDVNSSIQYTLYFSSLPLISINTDNTIVNEPKVLAEFTYSDDEQTVVSNIGIELRGGLSQSFSKKTYDIEFWEDEIGDETIDIQFGELRQDDDWILDALFNEPLRLRSYTANKLWKELHTPYYFDNEPNAKSGADVMYVEIFLNEQYNGIYNLSEQADRKQLKVKKFNGDMRGELYKASSWGGANTFDSLPSYNNNIREWGGYEFKHPGEDELTDWENLYEFTSFVMNSSGSEFAYSIWSEFSEDNFIDYFLFLNLIRAIDNTGKNIYLAKYNVDEPYFYVPWDLDGCFGANYDGTNLNITDDILTEDNSIINYNGLIDRVLAENPNGTLTTIANNWFDYRNDIFSNNSLSQSITQQYEFLQENKIYERESLVYPNDPYGIANSFDNSSLSYTLDWLDSRLEFLDIYFGDILSVNSLTTANKLSIYPNPAIDKIYISSIKNLNGNSYKIYNNIGQLIATGVIENEQIKIERLEIGIYLILINGNTFKLIKN